MNKPFYKFKSSPKAMVALTAVALLSACGSNAPSPCVEVPAAPQNSQTEQPAIPENTEKPADTTAVKPEDTNKTDVQEDSTKVVPVVADTTPSADTTKTQDINPVEPAKTDSVKTEDPKASSTDKSKETPTGKQDTLVPVQGKEDTKVDTTATVKTAEPDTTKDTVAVIPAAPVTRVDTVIIYQKDTTTALPPDPYQDFPALANNVFTHADTLYKQGKVDSAVTYLQRFRIIKPLWNQWENTADSLLQEYGKTNVEQAKQYEPLVLQIKNMNRVQTAYSIVAETADSLISLMPGDSLTRFAQEQKQIAYNNTLKRAQKEMATIRQMAEERAQFAEAEQRAIDFQMRHRDFEDDLKTQELIDYIRSLAQSTGSEAAKYWDSHDPAEALAQANELIEAKKFKQAKDLLIKLQASNLRKEAIDKYVELADAYCNTQRKETSQLFAKAQKQKSEDKKKELLQKAIAPLDKCLSEYPETSQKQKVLDNKSFLEKELSK